MSDYQPEPGSIAAVNVELQERMKAEAWRYDPQMEAVLARLEKNADDPALAGHLRMAAGLYKTGKQAARQAGRDVTR